MELNRKPPNKGVSLNSILEHLGYSIYKYGSFFLDILVQGLNSIMIPTGNVKCAILVLIIALAAWTVMHPSSLILLVVIFSVTRPDDPIMTNNSVIFGKIINARSAYYQPYSIRAHS